MCCEKHVLTIYIHISISILVISWHFPSLYKEKLLASPWQQCMHACTYWWVLFPKYFRKMIFLPVLYINPIIIYIGVYNLSMPLISINDRWSWSLNNFLGTSHSTMASPIRLISVTSYCAQKEKYLHKNWAWVAFFNYVTYQFVH